MAQKSAVIKQRLKEKKRNRLLLTIGVVILILSVPVFLRFSSSDTSENSLAQVNSRIAESVSAPHLEPPLQQPPSTEKDTLPIPTEADESHLEALIVPENTQLTDMPESEAEEAPAEVENPKPEIVDKTPPVRFESPEEVLGEQNTVRTRSIEPASQARGSNRLPDYQGQSLLYKLRLMSNNAYSSSAKGSLKKDILSHFVNPETAIVQEIYLESNGQQFSKSYPLGLYLLRLDQSPEAFQIGFVEEVKGERGLTGLIIKE